jgi:hypothetical protein
VGSTPDGSTPATRSSKGADAGAGERWTKKEPDL